MSTATRAAFFRTGAFSHTNTSISRVLEELFPGLSWHSNEIADLLGSRWSNHIYLVVAALRHYGPAKCWPLRRALRYGRRTPAYFSRVQRRVREACADKQFDFTFQTQSIVNARIPGIPHFVYTDHTQLANLYYPDYRPDDLPSEEWISHERSIYQSASVVFTMSSHVSRSLVEHYQCDPERVVCAYAGPNVPTPSTLATGIDRYRRKRILFVGRDWERKGGPQLVAAFARVLKSHPDAELTVVGCRPDIRLPNCRVVGQVPISEVGRYFTEASVFCMPTRNEPFGLVFIEAFSYALPVVSSKIGALPDVVEEGLSGYLVDPDDVQTLSERLVALLDDPKRAQTFGSRGRCHVESCYTWGNVARIMSEHIRRHVPGIRAAC